MATNANGGSWWPWLIQARYHRGHGMGAGMTPSVVLWLLYGVGFAIGIALYLLKTYVPFFWFINVPALHVGMTLANYHWLTSLIALVIKFVATRTVGIKRYEEYVTSAAAGWVIGYGAAWLPAMLVNFFTVAIPKMQALWIP